MGIKNQVPNLVQVHKRITVYKTLGRSLFTDGTVLKRDESGIMTERMKFVGRAADCTGLEYKKRL
jgi:hypothetical protein